MFLELELGFILLNLTLVDLELKLRFVLLALIDRRNRRLTTCKIHHLVSMSHNLRHILAALAHL